MPATPSRDDLYCLRSHICGNETKQPLYRDVKSCNDGGAGDYSGLPGRCLITRRRDPIEVLKMTSNYKGAINQRRNKS
eukprot:scaffold161891_cov17-Prasinocladus_malaysianus.AAC.1